MLAGGVGGFFMEAVNYPLETIKSRIQASNSHVNFRDAQRGKGFFRGFSTVFYVAFPGNALYFLGYDGSMYLFRSYLPGNNEHFSSMASAAVGEVLWSIFRNPFEVVKQQMQIGLDSKIATTCDNIFKAKGFVGALLSHRLLLGLPLAAAARNPLHGHPNAHLRSAQESHHGPHRQEACRVLCVRKLGQRSHRRSHL